ncbi:MAG: hypothetical protein NVSMB2_26090 [Chloroflexota bacterium]
MAGLMNTQTVRATQVIRLAQNEAIELRTGDSGAAILQSDGLRSADPDDRRYNAAIDGFESLVLALYGVGVDLEAEPFAAAIAHAYAAIVEQY